ncbi:10c62500-074a-4e43-b23c-d6e0f0b1208d [Sclerotinia trifoliorum]|uniref:Phospholipid-transporting ATPase n=1 Tax=Sclerotinia trifoliorum TaxID=28548 RepID=A0A8H2VS86_9HELO|nr:10c62500-074a-4e43-b23c-d6e0f0b1208d [Sclerotinia trifoliorum]
MTGEIVRRSTSSSSCDNISSSSSSCSNPPPSATLIVDPAPSTNKENHRVRFSVDVERERERGGFAESSALRPATPILSIDTRIAAAETAANGTSSTSGQGRRVLGISPISPRSRNRGYSLRRTLFARGLSSESEQETIELAETEHPQSGGKKTQSSVEVCPVHDQIEEAPNENIQSTESNRTFNHSDQKTFGTRELHNYDRFVRKVKGNDSIIRKAKKKSQWFYKEKILKDLLRQREIPPSKDGRHIELDATHQQGASLIDERTGVPYISNAIRSSRYTIWNFIPKQLFFQFSKLANAYFLLVSILQMVPGLSPTGSYTTIAPLLVFVMISMAKEGYDDVRRYKLDQVENNNQTLVLHAYTPVDINEKSHVRAKGTRSNRVKKGLGIDSPETVHETDIEATASGPKHWATLKWENLKVGDIIKLHRDEAVPADILLLHADGPNNIAFIETMALDGETNLKTKSPPISLVEKCSTVEKLVDCRAHAVIEDPNLDLYNFDGRVTVEGETLPLTTNEIVFRGSVLRNTSNAIGMVLNTGEECKIRMNANKNPRTKAPEMQKIANNIVIILVVFVVILALFCTIAYQIWSGNVESNSWYLEGAHFKFSYSIVAFIILFNTLIPLSLYVSLEIIKVGQLLLMHDVEMYDPVSDTPMVSNTSTILENLGQISYVFSDKTGTLTDNVMRFRKLSVAGYAWLHDFDLVREAAKLNLDAKKEDTSKSKHKGKGIARRFSKKRVHKPRPEDDELTSPTTDIPRRSGSLWRSSAQPNRIQPEFRTEEMIRYMQSKPHSIFTRKAKFFLLSIALCHTCLPEVRENGDIEFQAASPDELALVQAAQELGYLVIDRPARSITLTVTGESEDTTETYEVLDVIEFSSKRKRMSIIVRFPNGKICIFCKGADSSILPRLKLAPLAMQKVSEVQRRASTRKSLEAEEVLRRMSESSPRTSFSRPSMNLPRSSMSRNRKSIGGGRPSMASTRLQPIRDELDSWLRERESDVEMPDLDGAANAYRTPRTSMAMGRFSFASSDLRTSMQTTHFDEFVDESLVLDDAAVFERCFQHTNDFAGEGLRTLLFGYRFLEEQEYTAWKKIYLDATTSLIDRQSMIENAGEMIEQDFDLSGATAIEDKLQNGVPETVDKLRRANIKIWMLTGDKRETAINIAHSARIAKSYSEIIILDWTTGKVEQCMATTLVDINNGNVAHSVIVVDGQTLSEIDANQTLSLLFFDLVVQADSVICCRASPSQKASLVKKIRTKVNKSITLAIGDGANDIAMIQEAHVGIGISGKEGLQAARISDYSIAQFRFLQRLLFVHGHWNYIRTGKYILGTFWKEFLFYMIQAVYQKWNGYSGTSLFESASLTVFNTLFTSLCVIFLGVFDQDLSATTLLAVPELYTYGQRDEGFNLKKYFGWTFMAASEMIMIWFLAYGLFGESRFTNDNTLYSLGDLCFTAAVVIIVSKLLILEMHTKTYITAIGFILSIGGWFLWNLLLSSLYSPKALTYNVRDGFIYHFGRNALWWCTLIIILAAVFLLEMGVSSVRRTFWGSDIEVWQGLERDRMVRVRLERAVREGSGSSGDGEGGMGMGRGFGDELEVEEVDEGRGEWNWGDRGHGMAWTGKGGKEKERKTGGVEN